MTEAQEAAVRLIKKQQAKAEDGGAVWMAGEQLKDICRAEPDSAVLIAKDLTLKDMDLVREGKTLRHCVGGYGQSHVEGKIIVFIRRERRPERPYFTLNVDLTGKKPIEIQLHGYGNEYAHGKQLRIPQQVRAWCDWWEAEVLAPEFRRQRRKSSKEEKRV